MGKNGERSKSRYFALSSLPPHARRRKNQEKAKFSSIPSSKNIPHHSLPSGLPMPPPPSQCIARMQERTDRRMMDREKRKGEKRKRKRKKKAGEPLSIRVTAFSFLSSSLPASLWGSHPSFINSPESEVSVSWDLHPVRNFDGTEEGKRKAQSPLKNRSARLCFPRLQFIPTIITFFQIQCFRNA